MAQDSSASAHGLRILREQYRSTRTLKPRAACVRQAVRGELPPRYPLAKGVREYFAHDVIGAIHVGVEALAVRRPVETALEAPTTESRLLLALRIVDRQRVRVKEARLTSVALLGDLDLYTYELRLVGQHRDEAGMGHVHDVLIVPLAHARF